MKKKLISLVASAAILISMAAPMTAFAGDSGVSVWDGNATGGYSWMHSQEIKDIINAGSGTIHIDSAAKLAALALFGGRKYAYGSYDDNKEVPLDKTKFEGITFVLDTDIDLNGHAWSPICSFDAAKPFLGTFDGQGHTIYGMSNKPSDNDGLFASNRNTNGKDYFGLFGYMAGTVKNVKIKNASWEYNSSATSMPAGGGIAAFLGSTSSNAYRPLIDNCSVENFTITFKRTSTPSHTSHGFGGLAGSGWGGSITNCYVKDFTMDLINTTATPSCEGLIHYFRYMYSMYNENDESTKFNIKQNYVLNANKKTSGETTKLPFIHLENSEKFATSMNFTDYPEHVSSDTFPKYNADVEMLHTELANGSEGKAYYYDEVNNNVILKSEVMNKPSFFTLVNKDGKFTAKANLAKVADGTMLALATYEGKGSDIRLTGVKITEYDREKDFNTVIKAELSSEGFDSETQTAKAFIFSPDLEPYAEAIVR